MERDNLIEVRRDAHDKRYVNVTITEKGQETLTKCIKVAEKFIDEIMDSFTEDDLSSFSRQLHLMMKNTRSGSGAVTRDHKRRIHKVKKG
jgi:DNA-binding MarR family transcriptional regulator